MLVAYKVSKFIDVCTQHLCTLLKFGDQSDYTITFTRSLEIGCVSFLWTERPLFATLSLTLSKNHKLFDSIPCNVFLAPDLSKHYPKLTSWAHLALL